tara:strand:+ start:430 stop:651 length:222 start_codon:yes stop_codon:yes gene_type:complete
LEALVDEAKSHALKKLVKAARRARLRDHADEENGPPGITIILGMGRPEGELEDDLDLADDAEEVEEDEEDEDE